MSLQDPYESMAFNKSTPGFGCLVADWLDDEASVWYFSSHSDAAGVAELRIRFPFAGRNRASYVVPYCQTYRIDSG